MGLKFIIVTFDKKYSLRIFILHKFFFLLLLYSYYGLILVYVLAQSVINNIPFLTALKLILKLTHQYMKHHSKTLRLIFKTRLI
jgi:hypothetical protein